MAMGCCSLISKDTSASSNHCVDILYIDVYIDIKIDSDIY